MSQAKSPKSTPKSVAPSTHEPTADNTSGDHPCLDGSRREFSFLSEASVRHNKNCRAAFRVGLVGYLLWLVFLIFVAAKVTFS